MQKMLFSLMLAGLLSGCAAQVISTTTDVAIATARIPFKVGGAVVDMVTGD